MYVHKPDFTLHICQSDCLCRCQMYLFCATYGTSGGNYKRYGLVRLSDGSMTLSLTVNVIVIDYIYWLLTCLPTVSRKLENAMKCSWTIIVAQLCWFKTFNKSMLRCSNEGVATIHSVSAAVITDWESEWLVLVIRLSWEQSGNIRFKIPPVTFV